MEILMVMEGGLKRIQGCNIRNCELITEIVDNR